MTVSNDVNKAGPYVGDDSNKTFSFTNIKVFDDDDLTVVLVASDGSESTLVRGTDYSVSRNFDQDASPGGSITYPLDVNVDELSTDEYIIILREIDEKQESDITNLGGFYPDIIENMADRNTMMAQQNEERGNRSLRISRGATNAQIASMEVAANTRSSYPFIDSAGLMTAVSTALDTTTPLTQTLIGSTLWPQTAAELAAGVTPTYYYYPPGDIRRYGAIADDGVTDNGPLIQVALDVANVYYESTGRVGSVYVPDPRNGAFYGIDTVMFMRSGVSMFGDGRGSILRNPNTNLDVNDRVMHVGSYSGWGNVGDMHDEASYEVDDFVAYSGRTLTFVTPGEGSNFSVGQLVMVEDQLHYTVGANDYPIDTFAAKVKSVTANTVTLDRIIPINLTTDGATKSKVYALNTGLVTNANLGIPALCAENCNVSNLSLETTNTFWQSVMPISGAYQCTFENLWLNGSTGIPFGNPINHCSFVNIWCEYGRLGEEMGYCSGDNYMQNVNWHRTSDTDGGAFESHGVRENWDGGGRNEYYACRLDEDMEFTNGGLTVLMAKPDTKWFGGHVRAMNVSGDIHSAFQISRGAAGESLARNFTLKGMTLSGSTAHGIVCAEDRAIIEDNHIHHIGASYYPIILTSAANNCVVKNNRLGGLGETGSQYRVRDDSFGTNGHRVYDNLEPDYPQLHSHHYSTTQAHTGTTAETAIPNTSYTIPGGVLRFGDTYRTTVRGHLSAGSDQGTKTLRVKLNSTTIYTYQFSAAQGLTTLGFNLIVEMMVYNTQDWHCFGRLYAEDGTDDFDVLVATPSEPIASDVVMSFTVELADATDLIQITQVSHVPILQRHLLDYGLQG